MIGAYTIGKKAVQFGYKRYGIPGAIATGGAALAGYLIVRRALKSSTNGGNVDSAIDAGGDPVRGRGEGAERGDRYGDPRAGDQRGGSRLRR